MNFAVINDDLLNRIKIDIFDINDIAIFIADLIEYLGLNKYLNKIILMENDDLNNLAKYDFNTKNMKIYYKNIIDEAKEIFNGEKIEKVLFINLCIIQCIIHEIVHVYHNYLITECDAPIFQIYEQEIRLFDSLSDEEYETYYNCFIFERDAIITSYEAILLILKKDIKNNEMFDYFISELSSVLKSGYDNRSPIEKIYEDLFNIDAPSVSGLDLYDLLKLGTQNDTDLSNKNDDYFKDLILKKLT